MTADDSCMNERRVSCPPDDGLVGVPSVNAIAPTELCKTTQRTAAEADHIPSPWDSGRARAVSFLRRLMKQYTPSVATSKTATAPLTAPPTMAATFCVWFPEEIAPPPVALAEAEWADVEAETEARLDNGDVDVDLDEAVDDGTLDLDKIIQLRTVRARGRVTYLMDETAVPLATSDGINQKRSSQSVFSGDVPFVFVTTRVCTLGVREGEVKNDTPQYRTVAVAFGSLRVP